MSKDVYVFDVDGTLTPSRKKMDREFSEFFYKWMVGKNVVLVTGSDRDKTVEQIGDEIWSSADFCLQSAGNHIFKNGEEVFKNEWTADEELLNFLDELLESSPYPFRTSNFKEQRVGLLNFSVIGRGCLQQQRDAYGKWDDINKEREDYAKQIMDRFPDLEACVGGQISIDIHPNGANKGQTKKWVLDNYGEDSVIHFFGDRMEEGGNDHDLAVLLDEPHKKYMVENYQDTFDFLKNI